MKNHKARFLVVYVCVAILLIIETRVLGCDKICRNRLKRRTPMAVIVQNCDDSKIQIVDDDAMVNALPDDDNPDDETLRAALEELEDDDDEEFEEIAHEPKSIYKIVSNVLKRLHHVAKRAVKRAKNAEKRERLMRDAYVKRMRT